MDERLRFVARLLEGEKMAELCREFGISRKTGYKIFTRYKDVGLEGLTDRSRRPYRQANRLPFQVETLILGLSVSTRVGALRRSARSSGAASATSSHRPSARCTRFSIAMAW
jgi:transposase-like protein